MRSRKMESANTESQFDEMKIIEKIKIYKTLKLLKFQFHNFISTANRYKKNLNNS